MRKKRPVHVDPNTVESAEVIDQLLTDKNEDGHFLPSLGRRILNKLKAKSRMGEVEEDFVFDFEAFLKKKEEMGLFTEESDTAKVTDEVFNKQFEEAMKMYEDEELGEGRPEEDVGGIHDIDEFNDVMDEFLENQSKNTMLNKLNEADQLITKERDGVTKDEAIEDARKQLKRLEAGDDEEEFEEEEVVEEEHWDCETILSTYSNLENHPTVIGELKKKKKKPQRITLSDKTGIPKGVLNQKGGNKLSTVAEGGEGGEGSEEDEEEDEEEEFDPTSENLGVARNKGESKEEKKLRKEAAKQAKRDRRKQKKELKSEFKEEEKKQKKDTNAMAKLRVMPMY